MGVTTHGVNRQWLDRNMRGRNATKHKNSILSVILLYLTNANILLRIWIYRYAERGVLQMPKYKASSFSVSNIVSAPKVRINAYIFISYYLTPSIRYEVICYQGKYNTHINPPVRNVPDHRLTPLCSGGGHRQGRIGAPVLAIGSTTVGV